MQCNLEAVLGPSRVSSYQRQSYRYEYFPVRTCVGRGHRNLSKVALLAAGITHGAGFFSIGSLTVEGRGVACFGKAILGSTALPIRL